MSRVWIGAAQREAHQRVCASILALARAAAARLASGSAASLAEPIAAFLDAWLLAEHGEGSRASVSGLGRLGLALRATDHEIEPVLLALAAAPALDREIARAYAALDGELTAGLLLALASTTEAGRLALAGALHPDAPLRRNALLHAGADHGGAITAATPIAVAPTVVGLLRGEPVPLPPGIDELASPRWALARRALELFEVPPLDAGELVPLAGSAGLALAVARLLAAGAESNVWHVSLDDHAEPAWPSVLRDAWLCGAVCVIAGAAGPWSRHVRWIVGRTMHSALCILPPQQASRAPHALDLAALRERARRADTRELRADPTIAALVATIADVT